MRRVAGVVIVLVFAVFIPQRGTAQDTTPAFADAVKRALADPTSYAPALLSYGSQRLDWSSSQVFFAHGSLEHNAAFTISGRPDDQPIGFGAGNRRILGESLLVLQASLVNNIADRLVEDALARRYPSHRKLFKTLGWVERLVMASYLGYQTSILHFEQWQTNRQAAERLGY